MRRLLTICCILVMVLCLLRFYIYENVPTPENIPVETVLIQGRVDAWDKGNKHTILYLSDIFFYGNSAEEIKQENRIGVLCYIKEDRTYKLGQTVSVQGFLALPEQALNDGGFDAYRYYKSKGYDYILYDGEVLAQSTQYDILLEILYSIRLYAQRQLHRYLSEQNAGIMTAMLLGDKNDMDDGAKSLYREVGIYHILAVSGLHISLLGGCFYQLLKRIRWPLPLAAIVSLFVIWMYGLMIGMPPSAFRAIVMFGFGLAAPLINRSHDRVTSLAVAGACLILSEPFLILDGGVQLSFLAVLGITCLYPSFLNIHRYHMKFADGVWISFAVTYMTLPIIMRTYYEVPLYSLLANVCVIPLVPLLLTAGIVVVVCAKMFPFLAGLAAWVIKGILFYYEKVLQLFSALPGNRYVTGSPPLFRVVVFYALLFLLIFGVHKVKRKMLLCSLQGENAYMQGRYQEYGKAWKQIKKTMFLVRMVQIIIMILLVCVLFLPEKIHCRITFLDVGQGDGICIEAEDKVYLIDCGSTSLDKVGTRVLTPYLKYHGITYVDGWFLTHPDSDHVSAFMELCEKEDCGGIEIATLYLPKILQEEFAEQIKMAQKHGIGVVWLKKGDCLDDGNLYWEVLSPDMLCYYADENEASLVLLLQYDEFKGVFMGDAGMQAEEAVVVKEIEDVTLLKVAHHGSANDTNSEEFLVNLNAEIAVISCGRNNVYGHPHEETLRRLEAADSNIFCTSQWGQITIHTNHGWEVYGNKFLIY